MEETLVVILLVVLVMTAIIGVGVYIVGLWKGGDTVNETIKEKEVSKAIGRTEVAIKRARETYTRDKASKTSTSGETKSKLFG